MLKIRLSRVGKSHTPIYRLVVAEKSRAVKRENLEILGLYNPTNKEDRFQVKKDRVLYWISKGAEPSDTARNLLCDFDVLPKKDKANIVYGKTKKKKADKEEASNPAPVAENSAESMEAATEDVSDNTATEEPISDESPAEVEAPADEVKESLIEAEVSTTGK
ncbi:MAG: 30S ribosomal protein S16 [Patescibacteria group bacterium]